MEQVKQLTTVEAQTAAFALAQRQAKALSAATVLPPMYTGDRNVGNVMAAMNMATRMGVDPITVMTNFHLIQGKLVPSSPFIIGLIQRENRVRNRSELRYEYTGKEGTDDWGCRAWCTDLETGKTIKGTRVTIKMAKSEGWYTKNGSKWPNMPEQMLAYRAAAFFGRLYYPDVLNGIHTQDEMDDIIELRKTASASKTVDPLSIINAKPVDVTPGGTSTTITDAATTNKEGGAQ